MRRDASLESIGRVAEVPDDLSPLQLRTQGYFETRHFSLVGRIRKVWSEGSWNEWCASFDGGELGWLAEAQGDLVMTFAKALAALAAEPPPAALAGAAPGTVVPIEGRPFTISDVKQVHCVGAQGELGESAIEPACTSIDLRGPRLAFATLEIAGQDVKLFVGRFVEFGECRFTGLRALSGWSPESAAGGSR